MTVNEAIDWINKLFLKADFTDEYGDMDDTEPYEEAIKMVTEALNQTHWIHVNQRLPEEAERVLVYAERNAYDDKGVFRKKVIDIGWQVNGRWHIDGCNGVDGIAWMPLPTPYKVESEGRNDRRKKKSNQ